MIHLTLNLPAESVMKKICFNYRGMNAQAILHTHCNLRCKFCFETKSGGIRENNKINVDYIRKLPRDIFDTIFPTMQKFNIIYFNMNIMGGELFSDDIPDEIFDEYYNFAKVLVNIFDEKGIQVKFTIISNGIYQKYERILQFINTIGARIILSYDPIDRFSCDQQKQIWKNTFDYFKNKHHIRVLISTLLTRRTMYEYQHNDRMLLDTDRSIFVDTNIYVPRLDYHEYLPSDDDLFNFYQWCIDHELFNLSDINNIIAHKHICNQEWFFVFEEAKEPSLSDCLEGAVIPKDEYYGEYWNKINGHEVECLKYKQPIGILKRGCYSCEYFNTCSEMCWTQILFQHYPLGECPIKRIYEYISQNQSVIENFNQWRINYGDEWNKNSI